MRPKRIKNRRQFTRVPFEQEMAVSRGSSRGILSIHNLSLTGAYGIARSKGFDFEQGETVKYRMVFSGFKFKRILKGLAKIVWKRKRHAGIYFLNMEASGFEFLKTLLAYNLGSDEKVRKEVKKIWKRKPELQG